MCIHHSQETFSTWAIVDLLNYGEVQYGETYEQVLEDTGYSYGYLANLRALGKQIPRDRRKPMPVSVSHHMAVMGLPSDEQDAWLQYCLDCRPNRDTFNSIVYAAKKAGITDPKQVVIVSPKIVKEIAINLVRAKKNGKNELFDQSIRDLEVLLENEL